MRDIKIIKTPLGNVNADVLYSNVIQDNSSIITPFHFHHYIECHIIAKGCCSITCENKRYDLCEGDICIIPKLIAHNVEKISENLKKCVLSFTFERGKKEDMSDFLLFNSLFSSREIRIVNDGELCMWLVDNIRCADSDFRKIKMQSVFSFFLIRLTEILKSDAVLNSGNDLGLVFDERIFFIEEYIGKEYSNKISLSELSEIMHISERQINRILKQNVGMGFGELLLKQRMIVTVEKLEKTNIPIVEIARDVGFESYSGFFVAFKKTFGISPEDMRKKFCSEGQI